MSLMEFARLSFGLVIGVLATGSIFVIGYTFIEKVIHEGDKDVFIIVMAVLVWLTVSYGVIVLIL